MWISIFAIVLAIAVGSCVAAIMMRSEPVAGHQKNRLRTGALEAPPVSAFQSPQLSAQEYAEDADAPRPVSSSLGEHLRWHYRPVLNEPIPAHLTALARRLENLTMPTRGT